MCPSDGDILRAVSGELAGPERAALLDHLNRCAECARRFADAQRVWEETGRWQAIAPPADLTQRILARAATEGRAPSARWRVAAAVLIAAGVGVAAGQLVPVPPEPVTATQSEEVDPLGLDSLGGDATGFAAVVENLATAGAEEAS